MVPARKRSKRSFGGLRRLPSGRWQANYTGPDGVLHKAPATFDAKVDAEAWLADRRREIVREVWMPPTAADGRTVLFSEYAATWLGDRPLKPRTRAHYKKLVDSRLLPTFGNVALRGITPASVRRWHADQGQTTPTARSHAYGLLRAILATAVSDELLVANPVHIRGAGSSKRVHKIKPATLDELAALTDAMPARFRLLVLLASWCGLRFGELAELRRRDIDVRAATIRVRRGVVRVAGERLVDTPKSDAGSRDVAIPPHLMPLVRTHLLEHTEPGRNGLLFAARSGAHLAPSSLYGPFYRARAAAGRTDLRFHDLRHTGAVLAAATGATLAELMGRLGHSTPSAALRYQHAAQGRDAVVARALSDMAAAHQDATRPGGSQP